MNGDSELLLSLYREARERPTTEFQDFAFRLIRPRLRFASAVWGAGYFAGAKDSRPALVPISTQTLDIDPDGFSFWKTINRADTIIPIVRQAPWTTFNFHAPTQFAGRADGVMRDYARRFGRQSYLVTALATKATALFEWCSVYRPDPDDQFNEAERADCQMLMKHLSEALRVNSLAHQVRIAIPSPEGEANGYDALTTSDGRLLSAQEGFLGACRQQWSEFDERRLPSSVMRQLMGPGEGVYRARHVMLHARRIADLLWVRATEREPGTGRALRRMDAALLFARGHSYKAVARALDIAPSTARNHLAACYRDLSVSCRADLRAKLEQIQLSGEVRTRGREENR